MTSVRTVRLAGVHRRHDPNSGVVGGDRGGDLGRSIRRPIVGDHDLEPTRVVLPERVLQRLANAGFLVVRGDEQRDVGVVLREVDRARAVEEERRDELHVEVTREDRDSGDQRHGHRESDHLGQVVDPAEGDPGRETRPDEPGDDREGEAGADPQVEAKAAELPGHARGPGRVQRVPHGSCAARGRLAQQDR